MSQLTIAERWLWSARCREPTFSRASLSSFTGLEARMGIAIIVLIVVALLSIGIKVQRRRRTGSFFWWSGKDGPNT
jgi:hypothetical protein